MVKRTKLSDKAALREAKKLVNNRNSELRKKSRKALREITKLSKRIHQILPHFLESPTYVSGENDDGKLVQMSIVTRDPELIKILCALCDQIRKKQSDANNPTTDQTDNKTDN